MAKKQEAKMEPIGGSVNISARHIGMLRELKQVRNLTIRQIAEGAIDYQYTKKFGKAAREEKYGK
jgi:hypothetical protein